MRENENLWSKGLKNLLYETLSFTPYTQTVFENIVGTGKIAHNEQYLVFPQCLLLKQMIVSPFVHIFAIISLFAAELEEPKTDI